jgi:hypothetical protein
MMKRNYPGSDVAMLTAAAVITDNALADINFLSGKRSNWDAPYFSNLKLKIDSGLAAIGIDKAGGLRSATHSMLATQQRALDSLFEMKIQISEDFKSDKTRKADILAVLGFTAFYAAAARRSQTAIIKLLNQFKENLTDDLRAEIEAKGITKESLDGLVAFAEEMKAANLAQEVHKGNRVNLTGNDITLLNEIYAEVISIAKISYGFYKGNSSKQSQYSFRKILSRLSSSGARKVANISTEA